MIRDDASQPFVNRTTASNRKCKGCWTHLVIVLFIRLLGVGLQFRDLNLHVLVANGRSGWFMKYSMETMISGHEKGRERALKGAKTPFKNREKQACEVR